MNKQLFFSIALLAIAGTANAMQISSYNGPAKVNTQAGTMTAIFPNGTQATLNPSVQWSVNNGILTNVSNAPVAPAVAAPKAPAVAQATVARVGGCANGRCQRPVVIVRQGGCQGGRCQAPARPVAKRG